MIISAIDRLMGRLICHLIGYCTPDWTYARMCGCRPICRFCKRTIGG